MIDTETIIEKLWVTGEAAFETDYEEEFRVVFSRPGDLYDIVIYNTANNDAMGFVTLKEEGKGYYSIVNDSARNPHPDFVNTPGHGIVVKKKYRKRGVGAALLSLGVGIVQKDYTARRLAAPFRVVATDITKLGLGCYKTFGFRVTEGVTVSRGEFTAEKGVPAIDIRTWKMPFVLRFLRRLRR